MRDPESQPGASEERTYGLPGSLLDFLRALPRGERSALDALAKRDETYGEDVRAERRAGPEEGGR